MVLTVVGLVAFAALCWAVPALGQTPSVVAVALIALGFGVGRMAAAVVPLLLGIGLAVAIVVSEQGGSSGEAAWAPAVAAVVVIAGAVGALCIAVGALLRGAGRSNRERA